MFEQMKKFQVLICCIFRPGWEILVLMHEINDNLARNNDKQFNFLGDFMSFTRLKSNVGDLEGIKSKAALAL